MHPTTRCKATSLITYRPCTTSKTRIHTSTNLRKKRAAVLWPTKDSAVHHKVDPARDKSLLVCFYPQTGQEPCLLGKSQGLVFSCLELILITLSNSKKLHSHPVIIREQLGVQPSLRVPWWLLTLEGRQLRQFLSGFTLTIYCSSATSSPTPGPGTLRRLGTWLLGLFYKELQPSVSSSPLTTPTASPNNQTTPTPSTTTS